MKIIFHFWNQISNVCSNINRMFVLLFFCALLLNYYSFVNLEIIIEVFFNNIIPIMDNSWPVISIYLDGMPESYSVLISMSWASKPGGFDPILIKLQWCPSSLRFMWIMDARRLSQLAKPLSKPLKPCHYRISCIHSYKIQFIPLS